ncbi:MAG TPA: hypothetical protein VNQ78_17625 [Paracoccus sp. (in: a-proteobacteria)]|uniref:hypothetical protein n=1 Tax=Paracoccus sp. TaxID=267 RepID=UPI002B759047|nr:hypothetical protein [Paracoccus sp. (in: a-proteobacteria)]HWL58481.1 hypothetical protein [Paracoccus sp. (in: a-proteobacteria)]
MNVTLHDPDSAAFIYVIDPPKLTIEAIFLSASVRRHLPHIDLIAYCPEEKADLLPPQLREYLAATNTRLEFMPTGGVFSPRYKQGNKLIASAQPRPHAFTVFLDTDTVIWQPFAVSDMVGAGVVSAAPEGRYTWGKPEGHWAKAYGLFGMEVPEERIRLARTGKLSPPYFNGGVIAFPNAPVAEFESFADCWLKTALELDRPESEIPIRRPWLDQIALPVAIARAGLGFRTLDDRFNLSLTHKNIKPEMLEKKQRQVQHEIDRINAVDAFILHYHRTDAPRGLRFDGYLDDLLRDFTIFDDVSELGWIKHLGFSAKEVMAEFFQLKQIPKEQKTAEQNARWRIVEAQKHHLKKVAKSEDKYSDVWPGSILREPATALRVV